MDTTTTWTTAEIEHLLSLADQQRRCMAACGDADSTGIVDAMHAYNAAGDALATACEEFRQRHYPEADEITAALGIVAVIAPRYRCIYDGRTVAC